MIHFESKPDSSESNYSQQVRIFCCVGWDFSQNRMRLDQKNKIESMFFIKPFISSINHQPEANSSPPFTFSSRFLLSKLQPLHLITTWPTLPSQNCQTLTARSLCCHSAIITGQRSRQFPNHRQLWNTSAEVSTTTSISTPDSQYLETVSFLEQTPNFFYSAFCCLIMERR